MKTERLVLSFIAVVIGLLVAAVGFYFYQSTKTNTESKTKTIAISSSTTTAPTPQPSHFIVLDTPNDEEVVSSKTLPISGKTSPNTIIVISSDTADTVITPATNGSFTTTITLNDGVNRIEVRALSQSGEESTVNRTITYTKETF
jgi:cytoskeletal protein RodZ